MARSRNVGQIGIGGQSGVKLEWLGGVRKEEQRKKMNEAIAEILPRIQASMRANVPKDSGSLAASITTEIENEKWGVIGRVGILKDAIAPSGASVLDYAARVEFGFHGIDELGRSYNIWPQPFIRPALRGNQATAYGIFRSKG